MSGLIESRKNNDLAELMRLEDDIQDQPYTRRAHSDIEESAHIAMLREQQINKQKRAQRRNKR
jgi:hypothetical protein